MVTAVARDVFELHRSTAVADRVDRDKGVIRRVKILGVQSRNIGRTIGLTEDEFGAAANKPYRYALEALERAKSLYEGAKVYTNHPEFNYDAGGRRMPSKRDRTTFEILGRLQNVTVVSTGNDDEDGLYGDLHYLKSHAMAEPVCEAAERMPDVFALSHNASVHTELVGGQVVVTEILGVRSVDLVGDTPGTTHGLFETAAPNAKGKTMKKTIREILKATPAKTPGRAVLESMLENEQEQVAEMEAPPADAELVAEQEVELSDSPAPSADEQVAAAFAAAITAIVSDASLSVDEKKKKIVALLNAEEKVSTAGGETTTSTETTDEGGETQTEEKTTTETAAKTADGGNVVFESIGLLNKAGVPVMESYVEAMSALPSKARREAFANDLKKSSQVPGTEITARSREGKQVVETAAEKPKAAKVDYGRNPDQAERALRGMSSVE